MDGNNDRHVIEKDNIFSPGITCEGYILTWYDRTVTKCEPAAPIPEALSWLHPEQRDSRFLEIVDQQAADAEEGVNEGSPEETVEGVLVILVCAKDVMVRHNNISLVSRLPQLNALLPIYRLGREENTVSFLVNLLVVLDSNNCTTLIFPISHLKIIDLGNDSGGNLTIYLHLFCLCFTF